MSAGSETAEALALCFVMGRIIGRFQHCNLDVRLGPMADFSRGFWATLASPFQWKGYGRSDKVGLG